MKKGFTTRKFNGKIYDLFTFNTAKSKAKADMKEAKKRWKGMKIRIVPFTVNKGRKDEAKGWATFRRGK